MMAPNIGIVKFYILIYCFSVIDCLSPSTKKDELKKNSLPPCASCKVFTDSFKLEFIRTERGKLEGGDSSWEEENNISYKKSEVRLIEIQEKLCSEVVRGQLQCQKFSEDHEELIEDWWTKFQDSEPDLYEWLCISKLEVCCPKGHYGPKCQPCKGGESNPCNGNGKCKGDGTRKGNGQCSCSEGYEGELCSECSTGFYEAFKDDSKILCEACHKSCDGPCTKAGPKACTKCKAGWKWIPETGCSDINECANVPCAEQEYCSNNEGSYSCHKCDKSCRGCAGNGPEMCKVCSEGFEMKDGICVDKSIGDREKNVLFGRYVTYAGLTLTPCIILQRHTVLAAVVGLCVAGYISFSEYYLNYMQDNNDS